MAKKRPTVAEKKWMEAVSNYGCIACHQDGLNVPAEIHHIRKHTGMGLRPSHTRILPLWSVHHRTGKISVHLGKKETAILMAAYILNQMPDVKTIDIDTTGNMEDTIFLKEKLRQTQSKL